MMTPKTRRALALVALYCVSALGQSQPPQLPPCDWQPRTREAWDAEREWKGSLPKLWPEAFPEYAEEFRIHMARLRALTEEYASEKTVYDVPFADKLISELYVDVGHPTLNSRAQDYIIDSVIGQVAHWPENRLPPAARQRLIDGLLEYAAVDGRLVAADFPASGQPARSPNR